jgi:acyl carrier protein
VKDSVVVARPSDSGEQRLVAYVVPQQEASAAAGDLRRYIQERLPGYMIPSGIVLREALPMTANGKVNRQALPPVEGEQAAPEHEYVPPRNAVEQVLAGIWAEVLGREFVSVQDNFFELGGHSLMATQLISRIRGALHVLVPLRAVFEAPTIAALATHMTDDAKEGLIVEKTAQLLLAVHQMSEEQAARLLSDHSVAHP